MDKICSLTNQNQERVKKNWLKIKVVAVNQSSTDKPITYDVKQNSWTYNLQILLQLQSLLQLLQLYGDSLKELEWTCPQKKYNDNYCLLKKTVLVIFFQRFREICQFLFSSKGVSFQFLIAAFFFAKLAIIDVFTWEETVFVCIWMCFVVMNHRANILEKNLRKPQVDDVNCVYKLILIIGV